METEKLTWTELLSSIKERKKKNNLKDWEIVQWHEISFDEIEPYLNHNFTTKYFTTKESLFQLLKLNLKKDIVHEPAFVNEKLKSILVEKETIEIGNLNVSNYKEFIKLIGTFSLAFYKFKKYIKIHKEEPYCIETTIEDNENIVFTLYFSTPEKRKKALDFLRQYVAVFINE